MKPLPIPSRPWTNVTLDFVTDLPISNGYNAILMVVDCLTKERHYISCTTDENGTTTKTTAQLLLQNVWKLHVLPLFLTSDRGPQFISGVWKNLCKILDISASLSTSFHPEIDGQSEIANQEMERHLCTFVHYQQDDWSDKLPMVEFAANNNNSTSTRLSPFFASRGLHPRRSFDVVDLSDTITRERINKKKAIDISESMQSIWKYTQESLTKAQTSQSNQANKHRKKVSYDIGDKVWLSTKNISTDRPSKKLDHKMIGPFEVIGKKGISLELQLPQAMKIHNVFHPNLLQKASTDPLTGQVNKPAPPVIINNEEEWEVEDILNAKSL